MFKQNVKVIYEIIKQFVTALILHQNNIKKNVIKCNIFLAMILCFSLFMQLTCTYLQALKQIRLERFAKIEIKDKN